MGGKKPNPGSEEARKQGCICPVMDNEHGAGYLGNPDMFVKIEGCPIHWEDAVKELKKFRKDSE